MSTIELELSIQLENHSSTLKANSNGFLTCATF